MRVRLVCLVGASDEAQDRTASPESWPRPVIIQRPPSPARPPDVLAANMQRDFLKAKLGKLPPLPRLGPDGLPFEAVQPSTRGEDQKEEDQDEEGEGDVLPDLGQ